MFDALVPIGRGILATIPWVNPRFLSECLRRPTRFAAVLQLAPSIQVSLCRLRHGHGRIRHSDFIFVFGASPSGCAEASSALRHAEHKSVSIKPTEEELARYQRRVAPAKFGIGQMHSRFC